MSRTTTQLLAVALLVIAASLLWFSMREDAGDDVRTGTETVPRPPGRSTTGPADDGRPRDVRMPEIVRLTQTDWKRLFTTDYRKVPTADQTEILDLAAELDHALSTGGRADSEDAQVYVDAILSLLSESDIK